jgi:hypothetical protein
MTAPKGDPMHHDTQPDISLDIFGAPDPVLAALQEARKRRDRADRDIRILLAYAREFTRPRPYRLNDLAAAAGMSISGVRTGYTRHDIEEAGQLLRAACHQHATDRADLGEDQ